MTKGISKSIILHSLILIFFMYGAEIFKNNKSFEIYEIPLDVIDISDKTQSNEKKLDIKKKSTVEKFSPPKPKSRPNNFSMKSNDKTIKNKEDKPIVEKKIDNSNKKRMENILKSIQKIKSKTNEEKLIENQKKIEQEVENEDIKVNLGEKLTISELDMIRKQFYECWIVPAGAKDLQNLVVSIQLKLDKDGNVTSSKLVSKIRPKNPFHRAAAESALRAVNHPNCSKLKVPKKKYDTWKTLILDFNPSIMF